MTGDFSSETMQTRRQWNNIFKVPKKKKKKDNCQPINLYPTITPFKSKGKGLPWWRSG